MAVANLEKRLLHMLRVENETLREQVRQLKRQLVEGGKNAPLSWGLTDVERRLYAHMTSRELVTRESCMAVLYGHMVAPPDPKIIDVWLCKLRKKLAHQGVEIVTHWGVGWSLAQKSARAA